jgi:hypothetical protein
MTQERTLRDWYEELRRTQLDAGIIESINLRLADEANPDTRRSLQFILVEECKRQERFQEAEAVLRKLSEEPSTEEYPLVSLAEQKLYYEEQPEQAMEIIDRAIVFARISGNFRRLALGVKARVAIKLERWNAIPDILQEIMSLPPRKKTDADISTERDFFDRLPAGAINEALAKEYEDFCESRGCFRKP